MTCGLLLGMTRDEIERKLPEIEAFTELSDYLALPVRTYSSGMLVRLGFAIATAIDPEILLLDEGLGAGDARFATRAANRVKALIERSSIMVLASHSDELIRQMCKRAILLDRGRVVADGPTEEVLEIYARVNRGEPPSSRCRRRRPRSASRRQASPRLRSEHASGRRNRDSRRITAVYQYRQTQHREGNDDQPQTCQDIRRRRRSRRHPGALQEPVDQGIHHQSDPDAQGRHQRLRSVRPAAGRGDSRPPDLVRGLRRRFRRHDRAGPRHRLMGRQRQCENPGDDDQGRVHRPGGAHARQRRRRRST